MQSLAMLDALMEPEWKYRYFSFDARWSDAEQMGSMRNGSGDDLFAVFGGNGCFLRGFDHESVMSPWASPTRAVWNGVLDGIPEEFAASSREPAFHMEDTTFCIWRRIGDSVWKRGNVEFPSGDDPDGSAWMLSFYDGDPQTYATYALKYFGVAVPLKAIRSIFEHAPLSRALTQYFPTGEAFAALRTHADNIGYPS
jgi:hypothetical protein